MAQETPQSPTLESTFEIVEPDTTLTVTGHLPGTESTMTAIIPPSLKEFVQPGKHKIIISGVAWTAEMIVQHILSLRQYTEVDFELLVESSVVHRVTTSLSQETQENSTKPFSGFRYNFPNKLLTVYYNAISSLTNNETNIETIEKTDNVEEKTSNADIAVKDSFENIDKFSLRDTFGSIENIEKTKPMEPDFHHKGNFHVRTVKVTLSKAFSDKQDYFRFPEFEKHVRDDSLVGPPEIWIELLVDNCCKDTINEDIALYVEKFNLTAETLKYPVRAEKISDLPNFIFYHCPLFSNKRVQFILFNECSRLVCVRDTTASDFYELEEHIRRYFHRGFCDCKIERIYCTLPRDLDDKVYSDVLVFLRENFQVQDIDIDHRKFFVSKKNPTTIMN